MLGLQSVLWKFVYCQDCGRELTYTGGLVAENKKVYCNKDGELVMLCIANEAARDSWKPLKFKSRDAEELQLDIKRGRLEYFKRLKRNKR